MTFYSVPNRRVQKNGLLSSIEEWILHMVQSLKNKGIGLLKKKGGVIMKNEE